MAKLPPIYSSKTQLLLANADALLEQEEEDDKNRAYLAERAALQRRLPRDDPATRALVSEAALNEVERQAGKRVKGVEIVPSVALDNLIEPILYERLGVRQCLANARMLSEYQHAMQGIGDLPIIRVHADDLIVVHPQEGGHISPQPYGALGEEQYNHLLKHRNVDPTQLRLVNQYLEKVQTDEDRAMLRALIFNIPTDRMPFRGDFTQLPLTDSGITAVTVSFPLCGNVPVDLYISGMRYALEKMLLDKLGGMRDDKPVLEYAYLVHELNISLFVRWANATDLFRSTGAHAYIPVHTKLSETDDKTVSYLERTLKSLQQHPLS